MFKCIVSPDCIAKLGILYENIICHWFHRTNKHWTAYTYCLVELTRHHTDAKVIRLHCHFFILTNIWLPMYQNEKWCNYDKFFQRVTTEVNIQDPLLKKQTKKVILNNNNVRCIYFCSNFIQILTFTHDIWCQLHDVYISICCTVK